MKHKTATYTWFTKGGEIVIRESAKAVKKYGIATVIGIFITSLMFLLFFVGMHQEESRNDNLLIITLFSAFSALGLTLSTVIATLIVTLTHKANPIHFFSMLSLVSFILTLLITTISTVGEELSEGWNGFGFLFPLFAGTYIMIPFTIFCFIIKMYLEIQQDKRKGAVKND